MGGIDARVSEPMRNRAQINSSFEQVNRRAVPQNVRMNALLCQCRARSGGAFRVAHKNEPCAEAGEPTTTMIAKERLGLVERQSGFVAKLLDEFCGFRPQGADALLFSFGEELYGSGRNQSHVRGVQ